MTEHDRRSQDPIREALRQLPRIKASTNFNARLFARADRPRARPTLAWRRLIAAAVLLGVISGGLFLTHQHSRRLDYHRRRAAIERHHEDLRRELAEVRERAARSPRLYLGTASDVDLVLDLEPWMQQPVSAQPASYANPRP